LLAVGKGSVEEPQFIVMNYQGATTEGGELPCVGLVGKGITFDTGGISIKPNSNMYLMKSDMGGAAAVFGAVVLAARLRLPLQVVGVVPCAENMPDANAYKPSDVLQTYLGKTIEVIDTDAEGRIILADALSYIVKQFMPDYLIDLATLTGSAVATFGYQCAALFCNDDNLTQQLTHAGEMTGERLWRLPLWEAYADDLKSDVADITNLSSRPVAGAITAAKFLEIFTDKHPRWAHLDIAGVALTANEFGTHRNATAFGVRLLTEFMKTIKNK
jgi:leucyl aminopeptidase